MRASEAESEIGELRASFRAVLDDARESGIIRRHIDDAALRCEDLWSTAVDLGWFALLTPEAFGGLGLDRRAVAVLYEEFGRVTAPLPMLGAMAVTEIIARYGDAAQKAEWLPRLAAGEAASIWAGGIRPRWEAVQVNAGAATGEVREMLDGGPAGLVLAPVQDGDIAAWALIAAKDATIHSEELVDRTRGLASARLTDAAASPFAANDTHAIAQDLLSHASIALACDSIGGAREVLDLTVAYLKTREQFGKPIGSFQALKHRCAEHKVAIEAADALVRDAVERWARADADAALHAALAKALACEVYASVATDAVQLHGGIGFTWEHSCHLYLKRAKLNQVLFGASEAHRDLAATLLLRAA